MMKYAIKIRYQNYISQVRSCKRKRRKNEDKKTNASRRRPYGHNHFFNENIPAST